jgi:hypothetical protein
MAFSNNKQSLHCMGFFANAQNDKNKTFRMTDDSGGEILKEFRRHFPKLTF